ncbi:MAG: PIN domain-containing protein [Coriobacteriia bacterium]|nr:PIN domain-containing protein [Coriobacteriia bacterium]
MSVDASRAARRLSLLLDTNVWIDYYLGYRPLHRQACELVRLAVRLDADVLYAVTSSKDLFFLIAADFKREYRRVHGGMLDAEGAASADAVAWGCLEHLTENATAVGCDLSDIWLACKQRPLHADYEDNLIVAAAQRAKADLLVTSDESLLRHCPVAALDIPDAIAALRVRASDAEEPEN